MYNAQEIIQSATLMSGLPHSATIVLNNPAWARLTSAFMIFITDATVGPRSFNVDLVDNAGNIIFRLVNMPVDPSQTIDLQMALSVNPGVNTAPGQQIPELILMPPGSSIIVTDVSGVGSAADSISMNAIITY